MPNRGASVGRCGRRFTPYLPSDGLAIKPTASCPDLSLQCPPTILVSSPEDDITLDSPTEISSSATLVNSTFECDKHELDLESPSFLFPDAPCKSAENIKQRQAFQQKRVDYVSQLIDYTCQTLNEVWPTAGIPAIFRYRHGANYGYTAQSAFLSLDDFQPHEYETDLIPLQKFVREILRRSRSTCSTFQTALCYLEAIRNKIPLIQKAERDGRGSRGDQVDNEGRIEYECFCCTQEENDDEPLICHLCDELNDPSRLKKLPPAPPTPLPMLPSALLCPRRAFMGALVLSAKFVQDKAYSNRAWAKLCGLPAREVSRCERAIGDALEWRLWVGRDKAFALSGLEHKLGRAPTMLDACIAVEERDRKDSATDIVTPTVLGRSNTWPLLEVTPVDGLATVIVTPEDSFALSPTPSLCYSTSSGSTASTCPSGALSPDPLPRPSFVTNDPCSDSHKKQLSLSHTRIKIFLYQQALDTIRFGSCAGGSVVRGEVQDDFGMRVGRSQIEVV